MGSNQTSCGQCITGGGRSAAPRRCPTRMTARSDEAQLNVHLADALNRRYPRWTVTAERTRVIRDSPRSWPDIVLRYNGGQSIIVETEVEPAANVEQDAESRLGVTLDEGGERVEQVIALRYPTDIPYVQTELREAVEGAIFEYATLSLTADEVVVRWPTRGWLKGGVDGLAGVCETVALSEQALAAGLERLQRADHHRLRECLRRNSSRIMFLLTYDDHPNVRQMYDWVHSVSKQQWNYTINRTDDQQNGRQKQDGFYQPRGKGRELFIRNYLV